MKHILLVIALLSFTTSDALAKGRSVSLNEAPVRIDRANAKRLFIVGFAGQVTVTPHAKPNEIVIRTTKFAELEELGPDANALNDLIRQIVVKAGVSGDTLAIRAQLPPTRSEWTKWAQGKSVPQVSLDIMAPDNMNLEIYWTRGDVRVAKWKAPVVLTNQTGRHILEDIAGDVIFRTMYGTARIDNIQGAVNVENFSSQMNLGGITGKLKLRSFSGETHIRKTSGAVSVSSQKAPIFLQETTGALDVQTGLAAVNIVDHKGSLRGQSEAGAIEAKILGTVDVNLSSNTGPLSLTVPRTSRAEVSVASNKGQLRAPKSLEHKRTSVGRVIRGVLTGTEDGAIRLNSDSGDVNLKVL